MSPSPLPRTEQQRANHSEVLLRGLTCGKCRFYHWASPANGYPASFCDAPDWPPGLDGRRRDEVTVGCFHRLDRRPPIDVVGGKVYTLRGNGEMYCKDGTLLMFLPHRGGQGVYWATRDEIVRQAWREDLLARAAEAAHRGLECVDPLCWCRDVPPYPRNE